MRIALGIALALGFTLGLAACASSRAGWGKGRWIGLFESGDLQIRRGPIGLDPRTQELVLGWIGARVPEGVEGEIERCDLLVYRDVNGDQRAGENEALLARQAPQAGVRIQFDDVRLPHAAETGRCFAELDVRTARVSKSVRIELVPDP